MANANPSVDETAIEPNVERDDTDGGPGSGVRAGEVGTSGPDLPGEEPVDLGDDDGLDDLGLGAEDPGDDGNPLLQQNL